MSSQLIISSILNFWFGDPESDTYGHFQDFWFQSSAEFDQQIKTQFESVYLEAVAGKLNALSETPEGSLAFVILLDQFPRNMYRGMPQAFASDAMALSVSRDALDKKYDQNLLPTQRVFLYLPFEHSEKIENQDYSVALFEALGDEYTLKYAIEHRDVIVQFGRFPHRNSILGRKSTPDEIKFLEETNFMKGK
jgi:uncharacterized protein (DUF924 family)